MSKICTAGIKRLFWHDKSILSHLLGADKKVDYKKVLSALNGLEVGESGSKQTVKFNQIENLHQDSWTLEESEPSVDFYRNQLTGLVYRAGKKTPGELTVNFTIGQYEFKTKQALLGGNLIYEKKTVEGKEVDDTEKIIGWERSAYNAPDYFVLVIETEDGLYGFFPNIAVSAYQANTDGALGIGVKGTVLESDVTGIPTENWFGTPTA